MTSKPEKRYRALAGLNFPPGNTRLEPGEIAPRPGVPPIPRESVPWLLADGLIEPVKPEEN